MSDVSLPYRYDHRGRTAAADLDRHVRDLIESILFTSPGERVNRPSFGCGLARLNFDPNGTELAAATQFLVQSSLQEWLGRRISVQAVEVEAEDSKLLVTVRYRLSRDQLDRAVTLEREVVR